MIQAIKKAYPILDEKGRPCTFPTFASQVYMEDGTSVESAIQNMNVNNDSNSSTGDTGNETIQSISVDDIYPVGSIYMSVDSTSPASRFANTTWEQLKDRFLIGAGGSYAANTTGGEETHTLTKDELPRIVGTVSLGEGMSGASGGGYGAVRTTSGVFSGSIEMQYGKPSASTSAEYTTSPTSYRDVRLDFGGSQAHSNMPPYLAVYMWRRVS